MYIVHIQYFLIKSMYFNKIYLILISKIERDDSDLSWTELLYSLDL